MEKYNVGGMSCAACSTAVEKAVSSVEGVTSCSVNLLTNTMVVDGTADKNVIIRAVENAGYSAGLLNDKTEKKDSEDVNTKKIKNRLIASIIFLIVLMYVSMGHMMAGLPLGSFLEGNYVAIGIIQLVLSGIVLVINNKFFINGFKGIVRKTPNMDTLVALGSGISFVYSVYALLMMTDAQLKGNSDLVMTYMHELYFESAAMILTLITVGKMLESFSKGKTTNAIKSLLNLAPKTAVVIQDGKEKIISQIVLKLEIYLLYAQERVFLLMV